MHRTPEPKIVTISDLQAIRALAHGARLQVIDLLFASQEAMTATELAKGVGLTPSAMSYHLRALERWGYVVRADPSTDARERKWKATGTVLNVASQGGGQGPEEAFLNVQLEALRTRARKYLAARSSRLATGQIADPETVTMISSTLLRLTPQQRTDIAQRIQGILEEYSHREPSPEATQMLMMWSLLPEDYGIDESAAETG